LCQPKLVVEGFPGNDKVDGTYIQTSETFSDSDRGYYQNVDTDQCLWWHKPYRHWWMGHCSARGNNQGHVWLNPDKLCPSDASVGEWRRGGTDQYIPTGLVRVANDNDEASPKADQGPEGCQSSKTCVAFQLLFLPRNCMMHCNSFFNSLSRPGDIGRQKRKKTCTVLKILLNAILRHFFFFLVYNKLQVKTCCCKKNHIVYNIPWQLTEDKKLFKNVALYSLYQNVLLA
jgi:hypothetical protein